MVSHPTHPRVTPSEYLTLYLGDHSAISCASLSNVYGLFIITYVFVDQMTAFGQQTEGHMADYDRSPHELCIVTRFLSKNCDLFAVVHITKQYSLI